MGRPHKCPYCGEARSVSKGSRKTKTMGLRMIRLCRACNRKFTPRNQKQSQEQGPPSNEGPTDFTAETLA